MPEAGADTFVRLLSKYIAQGVIGRSDSVLVQFAGKYDEDVCAAVGLTNSIFVNIAPESHSTGGTSASNFDAHRMPDADRSFDHVIGHAGLHHCSRPHEALHEMYRLARKTVLFVENQDSLMMRLAAKVGVVGWYETQAVIDGGYATGGVDGTGVPNYVYRWTRREVEKAVASFDPAYKVPLEFESEWNLGMNRISSGSLRQKLRIRSDEQAERMFDSLHAALNRFAASQGNIFAVMIRKDLAVLHPWMVSPTQLRQFTSAG